MNFKRSVTPPWFIESLTLDRQNVVVCLDDDVSIHQVWQDRLKTNEFGDFDIKSVHLSSGQGLRDWLVKEPALGARAVYLMDYELLGQPETGLDLIENLGIAAQAILVTSRFEDEAIRKKCNSLGVKLIPKDMANLVPILLKSQSNLYDALQVDDETQVKRQKMAKTVSVGCSCNHL